MKFSRFFIDRPIAAIVLSSLIVIAGALSLGRLPLTEYPQVTPPTVVVRTAYPGANPKVIAVHPCSLPEDYPERQETCPVQVPGNLGGMTKAQAQAALQSIGLVYAEGEPFVVTDPNMVNTVRAHDPAPGTWLDVGSAVTVRLGVCPSCAPPPP